MTWKSPTVTADGQFFYDDGSEWEPYVWKKGEQMRSNSDEVYDRDAPDYTRMVAELLLNEVLFCNSRKYLCYGFGNKEPTIKPETLVLFVNCNDVFAWACSDAESVTLSELPRLYDMWKSNPTWGATQWCILKRNQRPQGPVLVAMKHAGAWTDELEQIK